MMTPSYVIDESLNQVKTIFFEDFDQNLKRMKLVNEFSYSLYLKLMFFATLFFGLFVKCSGYIDVD